VGTLVVGGLVIFFVPRFGAMFDSLRQRGELPVLPTGCWVERGPAAVRDCGPGRGRGGVLVIRQQLETEKGKRWRDYFKLRVPMLGPVFTSLAVARFCRVLGTLLRTACRFSARCRSAVRRGQSHPVGGGGQGVREYFLGAIAGQALGPLRAFPDHRGRDDLGGRESNTLDQVLVEIADGLERRTVRRLDLVVRLLEPMMLLILAIVVLCVVIALLMPVIKMSSTIGH